MVERELLDGDGEEVALVLGGGEGREHGEESGELGEHLGAGGGTVFAWQRCTRRWQSDSLSEDECDGPRP